MKRAISEVERKQIPRISKPRGADRNLAHAKRTPGSAVQEIRALKGRRKTLVGRDFFCNSSGRSKRADTEVRTLQGGILFSQRLSSGRFAGSLHASRAAHPVESERMINRSTAPDQTLYFDGPVPAWLVKPAPANAGIGFPSVPGRGVLRSAAIVGARSMIDAGPDCLPGTTLGPVPT